MTVARRITLAGLVGATVVVAILMWPRPAPVGPTEVPPSWDADQSVSTPSGEQEVDRGRAPEQGSAVESALALAAAPQDWLYLDDLELEAEVRAVATSTSADRIVQEVLAEVGLARDALVRSPGRIWWVVSPLAWRVESETGGTARVSVWTVSVLSAADVAMPQADWTTTTFDLEWDGQRWRLASMDDRSGPTPQLGARDQAWEPEPFDGALAGFTRVGSEPER